MKSRNSIPNYPYVQLFPFTAFFARHSHYQKEFHFVHYIEELSSEVRSKDYEDANFRAEGYVLIC